MAQTLFKKEKKEPWADIPIGIIIKKEEEERRKKEIRDSGIRQPAVYDVNIPYWPTKKEEQKEPERGVWRMYS